MQNNLKHTLRKHKQVIGFVAAAAFIAGLIIPNGFIADTIAQKGPPEHCTQGAAGPTGDPHTYEVCTGNPHLDPDNNPTGNPHNT